MRCRACWRLLLYQPVLKAQKLMYLSSRCSHQSHMHWQTFSSWTRPGKMFLLDESGRRVWIKASSFMWSIMTHRKCACLLHVNKLRKSTVLEFRLVTTFSKSNFFSKQLWQLLVKLFQNTPRPLFFSCHLMKWLCLEEQLVTGFHYSLMLTLILVFVSFLNSLSAII